MGRSVIDDAMERQRRVRDAVAEPDGWLVLDPDSSQVSPEQFLAADAMLLGRETRLACRPAPA